MTTLWNDLRYGLRMLAKSPGFTAVAVLSLALGIGANTTVLCWMRTLLWRPLPGVADQGRIVVIVSNQGGGNVSLFDLRDFAAMDKVFAGATASQTSPASLSIDHQLEWVHGQITTANYFDLLGVKPTLGRTFLPDEDRKPGGNPVLVLSERCWRRRFGADPSVVGRTVDLNRHRFTVIGVAPAEFRGTMTGNAFDFWAPLSMIQEVMAQHDESLTYRGSRPFHNLARLRPGVSVSQAQAAVDALGRNLAVAYPESNRYVSHRVLPYSQCPYGAQSVAQDVLPILMTASLGVLLIVVANVANLVLARSVSRGKEIAIRLAAGAGRIRLIRQLLTETLLLTLLGGIGGILLASRAINVVGWFLPPARAPSARDFNLDGTTLGLTVLLAMATGLIIGLVPAIHTTRPRLSEVLKEGGRSSMAGVAHGHLRHVLVVVEIALALVLLVGAGLCLQGLQKARQIKLGFEPSHVLVAGLRIGMNGYTEETGKVFYRQVQQRLAALPGVEEAALASWLPLGFGGCKGLDAHVEGYVPALGEDLTYQYVLISPRYFAAMKTPVVAGRDFTEADDGRAPLVAIVNEPFAERFWPGQEAVGRRFRSHGQWRTVVGVAKACKYNALNEDPQCFFFLPYQQRVPDLDLNVCLRTQGDPMAFAEIVRTTVRGLDPEVELCGTLALSEECRTAFLAQSITASLVAVLGATALLLAVLGVYAVMAYAVGQRTQEIGVRIALGATTSDVLCMVLRQGLVLAVAGVAAGLTLSLAVTRLLANFLYGVSALDPLTFIGVPLLLVLITLLACYVPARRAARIDPMEALRCE